MTDTDDQPIINNSGSEYDALDYIQIIGSGILFLVIGIAVLAVLAILAFMIFPGIWYFPIS